MKYKVEIGKDIKVLMDYMKFLINLNIILLLNYNTYNKSKAVNLSR